MRSAIGLWGDIRDYVDLESERTHFKYLSALWKRGKTEKLETSGDFLISGK